MLDSIIDFLNRNIAYAYPILFFGSLAESFFPPYPSDGIFVFSAFLAGRGVVSGAKAFILVSAGNLIGMMTVYLLGRKGLRPRLSKWISREDILSKADSWFEKHGDKVMLANRFIPGVRAPLCLSAGVFRLSPQRMFIYSTLSVLLWNGLLLWMSTWAGRNLVSIERFLFRYGIIAGAASCVVGVWVLFAVLRRRGR